MSHLTVSDASTHVEVVPEEGGRVQHVLDLVSGRELLYQRTAPGPRLELDFLTGSPGGWDEMFPNDPPWRGHPDHGRVWSTAFEVESVGPRAAVLRGRVDEPTVEVVRRLSLLEAPRRGLRQELELRALADTGPFLWASHPMLAAEPGWRIELAVAALEVDAELPGRFEPGATVRADGLTLPGRGADIQEVLYAEVDEAFVASPDERHRTRVGFGGGFLRHLWIVIVSGEANLDLCLLFEPCTTRPFRLDEAIERGEAAELRAGEARSWRVELESLDVAAAA